MTAVSALMLLAVITAGFFNYQAHQNATEAHLANAQSAQNLRTAEAASTQAVAEAQTRATQQAIAEANLAHVESLRLANEANTLLSDSAGNAETAALLSIRALQSAYSAPADAALVKASLRLFIKSFTAHTVGVSSVAFSPDGESVLTGSYHHTARLWDLRQTDEPLRTFTGHTRWVNSVAFSPDGKSVLTGSDDDTARLWNAATGAEVRAFTGHTSYLNSVAFSPDGKFVLTGSNDATARLWNVATGAEVRAFTGHTRSVLSVAFSPDGKYVLTGSSDATARLWNAATGAEVRAFTGHTSYLNSVTFSPDGKYVLTGSSDTTARLWNISTEFTLSGAEGLNASAETGAEARAFTGHTGSVLSVAFSPDGKYVLTGSSDATARLWNISTEFTLSGADGLNAGAEVRVFIGHTDRVIGVAFSPDGKSVLTGSWDNTARLWDTDYHDLIRRVCSHLVRDFTDQERGRYGLDGRATCEE